ncbi:MAG: PcfJ domain-containing protein [Roseibium sp.]|uniref:PcfJ domain-containing protein n=1 Tax=Roseibium sp. TaxID=1936156 RepID=UPI003297A6DC
MEIVDKKSKDGHTTILADIGDTTLWAIVKKRNDENVLTGFCGNAHPGSLPVVTPFTVAMDLENNEHIKDVGKAIMSIVGGVSIFSGEEEEKSIGLEDQLSAWSSFLSGTEVKAGVMEEKRSMEISDDGRAALVQAGILKAGNGSIRAVRGTAVRLGSPASGFDSLNVLKAVSAAIPEIEVPEVDVARAKKALKCVFRPSSNAVQWYGREGPFPQDRLQAAESFPILAGMIADQYSLAKAVDERGSLADELVEATGLTKGGLKRLKKLTVPLQEGKLFEDGNVHGQDALGLDRTRRINVSGVVSMETAMRHLRDLPPDRVPQDDKSWEIYGNILGGIAIPLENAIGIPVNKTLSACTGDWVAFHASLAKAAGFPAEDFDRRTIALTTIDSIEVIDDFSRSAILPRVLSSIEETGQEIPPVSHEFLNTGIALASEMILGKAKNVAGNLFETSRRYVGRITALMDILAPEEDPEEEERRKALEWSKYGPEEFPHLVGEYQASNGLVVRPLLNFKSMRLESTRLSHCVGRMYLNSAKDHSTHIFSVQSPAGDRSLSTMELSAAKGETLPSVLRDFRVIQHRAMRNCAPPADASKAVSEFMADLKGGNIKLNLDESRRWREFRKSNKADATPVVSWASALEMEWQNADTRNEAWGEWATIIGGNIGKSKTPDIVYREAGVREMLRDMSPQAAKMLEEQAAERAKAAKAAKEAAKAEKEAAAQEAESSPSV